MMYKMYSTYFEYFSVKISMKYFYLLRKYLVVTTNTANTYA